MSSSEVSSTTSTKKKRRFFHINILQRFGSCSEKADNPATIENGTSTTNNVIEATKSTSTGQGDLVSIKNEKLVTVKPKQQRSSSSLSTTSTMTLNLECPLCLISQPMDNFPRLSTCLHYSCMECLRQYLTIEITESRVNVTCPECQERLHPNDIKFILSNDPDLVEKWEEFMLRRTLSVDPDCRWCPAPDCGYAVIAQSCASCPKLVCERPGCNTSFCYHCRQEWHPDQTCDAAHLQRTRQIRMRNNSMSCSQSADEIKPCPKCGALIVKMNDGSCNHMTCTVCDAEFCWLCLQEITDLHYLSPSGCTFWGKKPWSRKKKILWQLGLLIGAPLGIALVAGVAVPAIIIGLPFWVARKMISNMKKKDHSKHRRNLVVVGCVASSVLLSPPLAALTVGIGVPVMLIYVYGVVPFSLCRTGSYGLGTAGDRSGVNGLNMANLDARFQRLDAVVRGAASGSGDSAGIAGASTAGRGGTSTSVRGDGMSPSIGEASESGITMASLNLSHSSNLDKLARPDHDASSTMAIAGSSITGSISGISGIGVANRLDIQNGLATKDVDQQSNNFSMSSSHTSTSVQVLVHPSNQDTISEQGFSSTKPHPTIKKTNSSKSLGSRRKTKLTKKSSSPSARRTYDMLKRSNTLDDKSIQIGKSVSCSSSGYSSKRSATANPFNEKADLDSSSTTIVHVKHAGYCGYNGQLAAREDYSLRKLDEVPRTIHNNSPVNISTTTMNNDSDASSCGSQSAFLPQAGHEEPSTSSNTATSNQRKV